MDERTRLRDMVLNFTNDQKSSKTKILIQFEEFEEKPTELTFTVPNPFVSRFEMIAMLNTRIEQINSCVIELRGLEKQPVSKKKKGFPTKKEKEDPFDEYKPE